jgi:hypothetical protein
MHMRPSFERILSPLRLPVSPRSRQGFQRLFPDRCKSEPGNGWETPGASGRQSPEKVPNPHFGSDPERGLKDGRYSGDIGDL